MTPGLNHPIPIIGTFEKRALGPPAGNTHKDKEYYAPFPKLCQTCEQSLRAGTERDSVSQSPLRIRTLQNENIFYAQMLFLCLRNLKTR